MVRKGAIALALVAGLAIGGCGGKDKKAETPELNGTMTFGVLAPIAVGDTCAMCHGPAKFRPPDVDALLKATYPHDRANDYTNGDLRGFYWAEVSKVDNTQ